MVFAYKPVALAMIRAHRLYMPDYGHSDKCGYDRVIIHLDYRGKASPGFVNWNVEIGAVMCL